ncbi:GGDEF domain-containing protein [Catenovulum sp. SX2]|uniref:GGDEF domain-containing protein n=1 Tax=Catenovulum sp. SX2 TaxID=3398614 RepID=UPI003F8450C5
MVIADSQILWLVGVALAITIMASIQHSAIRNRVSALTMAQGAGFCLSLFALIVINSLPLQSKILYYLICFAVLLGLFSFVSMQIWLTKWLLNPKPNATPLLFGLFGLSLVTAALYEVNLLPSWANTLTLATIAFCSFAFSLWLSLKANVNIAIKLLLCLTPAIWLCATAICIYSQFMALLIVAASMFISQYLVISRFVKTQQQCLVQIQSLADDYREKSFKLQTELAEQQDAYEMLESDVRERNFELEVTLRELQDKNRELEQLNTLDALTGVRNRRYFDQRIEAEIRRGRREQTELGLIMLDIDHFKSINDKYGHLVGDQVIQHIASLCKKLLPRSTDALCRYGGEEFAIILPNTPLAGVLQVANHLREQIESSVCTAEDCEIQVTASLGVHSQQVSHESQSTDLIALADKALYQAKQAGRNQVCQSNELNQILATNSSVKPLLN